MRNRALLRPLVALTIAVSMVVAFGGAAQAATVVKASGTSFRPRSLSVAAGTKVVWKAVSGSHTVTAYKGRWTKNSGLPNGGKTSFTFSNPGTYKYFCRFHGSVSGGVCSGMCGKVTVT